MTVYSSDLSIFLCRNDAGKLQRVLRAFAQKYFPVIWDEGIEPSLKARLAILLATHPEISSDYQLIPELTFRDESRVLAPTKPPHFRVQICANILA
jgi:hypothetical protein